VFDGPVLFDTLADEVPVTPSGLRKLFCGSVMTRAVSPRVISIWLILCCESGATIIGVRVGAAL